MKKKIKVKYRYLSEIVIAEKLKVRTSRCIFFFVGRDKFYEYLWMIINLY